jgi:hypothetical protein
MKKIKWLFPLMFLIALGGSAFTRSTAGKAKKDVVNVYYQDSYGYCDYTEIVDPNNNCVSYPLNYICSENVYWDGTGWTVMYQYGFTTVCAQPYYSYYPNN